MSLKSAFNPLEAAERLISTLLDKSERYFVLAWEGTKIPRGAQIDGVDIGWTQHGIVTGANGENLGYYERIVECGGPDRQKQVMLIGTDGLMITPPPGGTVEPVRQSVQQVNAALKPNF